jgi:radical SAM protein with 4Fe4S-binding SPASM domain
VECSGCPETTLGELGDELLTQLQGRRFPLGGSFEITERCNLSCVHCFINQPAGSQEAASGELTLLQIRGVLDQLAEAGCLFLLLTGGEPLLRPDFCDVYRYAKRAGMLVSLFTNGTLLTPRIADFLAEWRPAAIEITLYGATQATYERVTQVPGSYARCVRGIELALDRGLRLNLKTVLVRANRHELDAMGSYAERLGVRFRFDSVVFPRLDGGQMPAAQRLSPGEIVALDQEYPERQQEFDRLYRECGSRPVRSEYVFSCGAGYHSFHVDSAGRLSPCMLARQPAYSLLDGSFREGWEEFLGALLSKKRTLDTPCPTCSIGALCIQCPGWSQLVHGDDETPVDYVCELGRLRSARMVACSGSIVSAEPVALPGQAKKLSIPMGPPD